jgi:hypothetical protein
VEELHAIVGSILPMEEEVVEPISISIIIIDYLNFLRIWP